MARTLLWRYFAAYCLLCLVWHLLSGKVSRWSDPLAVPCDACALYKLLHNYCWPKITFAIRMDLVYEQLLVLNSVLECSMDGERWQTKNWYALACLLICQVVACNFVWTVISASILMFGVMLYKRKRSSSIWIGSHFPRSHVRMW